MRVAAGFERVAEEFVGLERSAFAAVIDGELVVDLWSGPDWSDDTLVLVFSGTKGLVAVCLLLLIEQEQLELDAPVARYWPEFRHRDVLVRHVVSHTAGLPGLRPPPSAEDILDPELMAARLAAEPPVWPAGRHLAYHALTFGWLCGELLRRIDGRTLGRFFAEEIATPLDLELWIGLPTLLEPRVAELTRAPDYGVTVLGDEPAPLLEALYGPMLHRFVWNDPAYHAAEIPAANGIGTACSLARLYGRLGEILQPETIRLGRTELSRGVCAVTRFPYAFGVGFELQTELKALGPPTTAFGHTGSGGSSHGAWPDERVGFSFTTSELHASASDDRARRLLAALHACL